MAFWMSIEILDGSFAASLWAEAWGDSIVETAVVHGAVDWGFHRRGTGIVFEVKLPTEAAWGRFYASETMRAALEAAPDPTAVIVCRGRIGTTAPRRSRSRVGTPFGEPVVEEDFRVFSGDVERRRATARR